MNTDYDVIIIGAGVAGLFAASMLTKGKNLLIEKNVSPGKKLLISGAGQCNYTHYGETDDLLKKYGSGSNFLRPSLYNFSNDDTIKYFKNLGIESIIRNDGKVFPESLKASDILNALLQKIKKNNNTKVKYNSQVVSVSYNQDLNFFTVKTTEQKYTTENLIISTGGKSYPNTGSTGDGYNIASEFGHSIADPSPCLTPVNVEGYNFSDLSGISFKDLNISIWRDKKKIKDFVGDILFTHKNISGPGILNFSKYIKKGDILKVNFIGKSENEVRSIIENEVKNNGKQFVKSIFKSTALSKRFIDKIFEICSIPENLICSQLSRNYKNILCKALCEFNFTVESLGGYHIAMATCGGVSINEINRKTMQSKLINGLYFAGEVMNIDGETGGYNIQAAFSTAKLAVDSILNKKEE